MKLHLFHHWRPDGFSGNPDHPQWHAVCKDCGATASTGRMNADRNATEPTLLMFALMFFIPLIAFGIYAYLYVNRII